MLLVLQIQILAKLQVSVYYNQRVALINVSNWGKQEKLG